MAITALLRGPAVAGSQAVAYPDSAGDVVYNRFAMSVPASTVVNTVLEIGVIPPNCKVVDMVIESAVTGAGVTCDVGVISDSRTPWAPPGSNSAADLAARTCGAEFFTGTAIAAAGAVRMGVTAPTTCWAVAPAAYERGIGVKVTGATTAASVQPIVLGVWFATT